MTPEDSEKTKANLAMIKTAVFTLTGILPDEQKHVGSELQRIDALANDLYHKYIEEAE